MKITLNGEWRLHSSKYTDLKAMMPGSVLSTLLAHGLIEDPFYRDNEETVRRCLYDNYTLTRQFSMTEEQLQKHNYLFLDGIDTIAKVFINDNHIIDLFDMHTRKRILLDNAILQEENEIRIEFSNVYDYIENYPNKENFVTYAVTHPNAPVIRKSHHMLGWDWGPDLADMGIYRDIYILSTKLGYLESFRHECTFLPGDRVKIDVETHAVCCTPGKMTVTLSLDADGTCMIVKQPLMEDGKISFLLENPKRWYPVGFGEPTLYDLSFEMTGDNGERQNYAYRIGIREVEIDNSPDEYGTNFCVRINGEKVFLKGSNYIPEDNILSRCDKERNHRLLQLVKNFNHNVIRVWGGGYYPDEWFYEYCDENGILVWQDLMFACASYNIHDEHFKNLIVEEVTDAVKRFRHHASVFYISGDNECEDGVNGHEPHLMEQYRIMSQEILVPLMKTLTSTFYAYTSPHSKVMFCMQNDHDHFDTHYWGVRDARLPLEQYKAIYPRMLAEVGWDSLPMIDTLQCYMAQEDMHLDSPAIKAHEKRPGALEGSAYYVHTRCGEPETFEEFVYLQNLVQGDAIKMTTEHLRTNKFRCNGVLYWQLNECWPGLTWSSVDYHFGLKALHYFSKKFFAPHLIAVDEKDGNLIVSIANDTPNAMEYGVEYRYMNFAGDVLDQKSFTANVEKTDDLDALVIPTPFGAGDTDKLVYVKLTDMDGNVLSENFYQHCLDREIDYPKTNITVKAIDEYTVELTADTFAKNVFLQCGATSRIFSDNFCSLLPGEGKLIRSNEPIDMEKLTVFSANDVKFQNKGGEK